MTQTTTEGLVDTGRGGLIAQDWNALTFRVNRTAYRSAEVFQAERERIWNHHWLYLGHETEIPQNNDYKVRTLGGRPLIFVRGGDGVVRAFLNSCPHRGTVVGDRHDDAPRIQRYGVRGNWKLAVENAMDGYHFAPTHNTFVGYLRETGFAVTDDDQYAYDLGNGHSMLVLTGHNGRLGMLWEPRFGEAEKERTRLNRARHPVRPPGHPRPGRRRRVLHLPRRPPGGSAH